MKKFLKIMLITLGFGLVTVLIGFLTSRPTTAQFPPPVVPVKVTNTPLPVTVSNFPAIQSVNFNGAPQPVFFSNTTATPLFTRDVDNPVRQPVFGSCDAINLSPVNGFVSCDISFISPTSNFSSVPAGKRLVIEFVSGEADVPTGTKPLEFGIRTSLGNGYTDIDFVTTFQGTTNINGIPLDEYKVGQQTRIYEGTNATVHAEVSASDTTSNPYSIFVTVTGYLVNVQ
ncbi:MAG TPA: hypothetical protein VK937_18210 [Candidatus Limnocylindria bacterium]|nr:hypothetical protein [Candidatus Limnocylindria bacterium]